MRNLLKFIFTSFFILCEVESINAQVAEWTAVNPGVGTSTCMDQFNNSFTCGQYIGPANIGNYTFQGFGLQDVVVQKYSPSGNLLWATDFGGTQSDYSQKMTYDGQGAVWITGQFSGTMTAGAFTLTSAGGSDVYLVKIDAASGAILYAQRAGNSGNDVGMAVAADANGNILLSGTFNTNFNFGSVSISGLGTYEVFLVKLTNAGVPLWGSGIKGTSIETMWSLAVDANGNSYIGGYSSSAVANFNGVNQNFSGQTHFIVKFNQLGVFDWISTSVFSGELDGLATDNAGNVYFTGNFDTQASFGAINLTGVGMDDILVGKIDPSGAYSWVTSYGGGGNDDGYGIASTGNGELFVVGTFQGAFTLGSCNFSSGSFSKSFIFKLNSSGVVQWAAQSSGASSSHISKGIIVNDFDDIYLTGWGSGTFNMGGNAVNLSAGGYLVKMSDNANIIQGTVFTDVNADGQYNIGELGIPNVILALNSGPAVTASNNFGNYNMFTVSGSQTVSIPNLPLYHTLSTPANITINFTGMGNLDTANVFGLIPVPNMKDLNIDITPISAPKAGHVLTYLITYTNQGTISQNASVTLQASSLMSYLGTSPAATSVSGQSMTWDLGLLIPQQSGTLFAQFNIPANTSIGTMIQSTASISPTINDQTPSNNTQLNSVAVTGPFDPNYKEVNADTLYDVMGSDYLEYLIHFQNVGNDLAYNVIIIDTMSTLLDLTSFELISKSHPNLDFNIKNGNIAEFRFNNIMLPDSLSDPIGSQGFVKFRVKYVNAIPLYTNLENFADIYFDYNTAIRTDTANTYFSTTASFHESNESISNLAVYPNPALDEVHLAFEKNAGTLATMELRSLSGSIFLVQNFDVDLTNVDTTLSFTSLAKGVYFLSLSDGKNIQVVKLIKP